MMDTSQISTEPWTTVRAGSLAVGCLVLGIAGGWLLRGMHRPTFTGSAVSTSLLSPVNAVNTPAGSQRVAVSLREMTDAKAAPLLDQLKENPTDTTLLTNLGNLYYDSQQYTIAIGFYGRALKIKPSDADVRTDMATAYWYTGDADTAIAEFNKVLDSQPELPNALFNRGLVK